MKTQPAAACCIDNFSAYAKVSDRLYYIYFFFFPSMVSHNFFRENLPTPFYRSSCLGRWGGGKAKKPTSSQGYVTLDMETLFNC
ncbi:hypothetical protein GDO81_004807 [Engystomops pustulosus]|uniref:Uncharacterized protein n=1 Tax=Engystomops pustulosus TaxID=76066 RepID=A0AAV7CIR5_ENGPU|nr:hypothetical protein GDO81_004807 [Engystomops pustulosus]